MQTNVMPFKCATDDPNTVQLREIVGWVERNQTQQIAKNVGFRSSTQPTLFKVFGANTKRIVTRECGLIVH